MRYALHFAACLAVAALAGPAVGQSIADFERIDANKDGAVSAAEFEAARRRDFDLLDADKDGRLSREEFIRPRGASAELVRLRERRFGAIDTDKSQSIAWEEYLAQGRHQFAVLDRDRDGRVTRAEFEAALAGSAPPPASGRTDVTPPQLERPPIERPPARGPRPPPPTDDRQLRASFERIDKDRNGSISLNELDAARLEAFQQMDTNGDGRLSRAEIVAARGDAAAARFTEIDLNKDSFVSRPEFLAAGRAIFRAADADTDGKLTFEEFARTGAR
jgi:Ca2+-binding EF-hand superfamily protein